jgi:vacuolar-type H+-ATPase subunit I/STV1
VDKALNQLSTLSYDLEVVKMTAAHAAMKKDLDLVEQKLHGFVKTNRFDDLQRFVDTLAPFTEITRLDDEITKLNVTLQDYELTKDVNEKISKVSKELWAEIDKKHDTEHFERKYREINDHVTDQTEKLFQETYSLREISDRTRKKLDETSKMTNGLQAELDKKMQNEEGKKLWAHFKRYALYNDLRDLYKQTLPEIKKFEDRLHNYHTQQDKQNEVLRRFDEVLAEKGNRM